MVFLSDQKGRMAMRIGPNIRRKYRPKWRRRWGGEAWRTELKFGMWFWGFERPNGEACRAEPQLGCAKPASCITRVTKVFRLNFVIFPSLRSVYKHCKYHENCFIGFWENWQQKLRKSALMMLKIANFSKTGTCAFDFDSCSIFIWRLSSACFKTGASGQKILQTTSQMQFFCKSDCP